MSPSALLNKTELNPNAENEQFLGEAANEKYDFSKMLLKQKMVLDIDVSKNDSGQLKQTEEPAINDSFGQDFNYREAKKDYLLKIPKYKVSENFIVLQKWEGSVQKVGKRLFVAILKDLVKNVSEEEVVLDKSEVPEADQDLLVPGAVFYWHMGYIEKTSGQRNRTSSIRFRRLPATTIGEAKRAEKKANELHRLFND